MKKYNNYKDSDVEWIGKIPSHWIMQRIDWVSKIVRGNTAFKKDELLDAGEYIALQYGKTYKVDVVDDSFNFYVNSEFFNESQVTTKGDTILISTSETIEDLGHTCFYNNQNVGLLGGEQILLKPNRKFLHEKYLYHYSRQFGSELRRYARGLKVFRFNTSDLKQLFIAIPTLEEQLSIANYLDNKTSQIDHLISKKEKFIKLLEEERVAVINQAVTKGLDPNVPMKDSGVEWLGEIPEHWEVKRLKFIGNSIGGLTYSPNDIVESSSEGVLVLRSSNIQNGKLSLKDNVYVNLKISDKLTLKKGDILICSRNGSQHLIGKNICIDEQMEGNTFGAFMMIFRSNNWKFLSHYFNSSIFTSQSGLFLTATINQLTSNTLNNFFIAIPKSNDEQILIAEYIDNKTHEIDCIINKSVQEIELLKEYKTALISEVVTGKVDVSTSSTQV